MSIVPLRARTERPPVPALRRVCLGYRADMHVDGRRRKAGLDPLGVLLGHWSRGLHFLGDESGFHVCVCVYVCVCPSTQLQELEPRIGVPLPQACVEEREHEDDDDAKREQGREDRLDDFVLVRLPGVAKAVHAEK